MEELARISEITVQAIRISPPAFSLLKNCWNNPVTLAALLIVSKLGFLSLKLKAHGKQDHHGHGHRASILSSIMT